MTPDPIGNVVFDLSDPQSANQYAYVKNRPLTRVDPTGTCDVVIGGITQSPGTSGTSGESNLASKMGAQLALPYAGGSQIGGVESVLEQAVTGNAATMVAEQALLAAARDPGPINVITFSGGAQAFTAAMAQLPELNSRIGNVTYLSPGLSSGGFVSPGGTTAMGFGLGPIELGVTAVSVRQAFVDPNITELSYPQCDHNSNCAIKATQSYLNAHSGNPCSKQSTFTPPTYTPVFDFSGQIGIFGTDESTSVTSEQSYWWYP